MCEARACTGLILFLMTIFASNSSVHKYYKRFYKCYKDGMVDHNAVIGALLKAWESTKDEYAEVWNEAAKMKQVISYFLYNGTMHV
jgi:hypothetical protein